MDPDGRAASERSVRKRNTRSQGGRRRRGAVGRALRKRITNTGEMMKGARHEENEERQARKRREEDEEREEVMQVLHGAAGSSWRSSSDRSRSALLRKRGVSVRRAARAGRPQVAYDSWYSVCAVGVSVVDEMEEVDEVLEKVGEGGEGGEGGAGGGWVASDS